MGRWSEKKNEFYRDVAKVAFPGFFDVRDGYRLRYDAFNIL